MSYFNFFRKKMRSEKLFFMELYRRFDAKISKNMSFLHNFDQEMIETRGCWSFRQKSSLANKSC